MIFHQSLDKKSKPWESRSSLCGLRKFRGCSSVWATCYPPESLGQSTHVSPISYELLYKNKRLEQFFFIGIVFKVNFNNTNRCKSCFWWNRCSPEMVHGRSWCKVGCWWGINRFEFIIVGVCAAKLMFKACQGIFLSWPCSYLYVRCNTATVSPNQIIIRS